MNLMKLSAVHFTLTTEAENEVFLEISQEVMRNAEMVKVTTKTDTTDEADLIVAMEVEEAEATAKEITTDTPKVMEMNNQKKK